MAARATLRLLDDWRPNLAVGVVAAAGLVALTTLLLYPLRNVAPVVSLGVVYLVGVLLVSSVWGAWLGIVTALASAAAFNWFHIPPTGRFSIREGENWVALVVFLIAAVIASTLAQWARARASEAEHRRREADLSAEMARLLLRGERLDVALPTVSRRLAQSLDLPSAAIDLRAVDGDERRVAFPLRDGTHQIGTLLLPAELSEEVLGRVQRRVVPSLEALLAAALERDALVGESVETQALRRSDVLKTALLRTVSHDLRSPLTAILTAADALASPSLTEDERADMTSAIREEAQRLARLIDNLLDLSRLRGPRRRAAPLVVLDRGGGDGGRRRARPRARQLRALDRRRPPARARGRRATRAGLRQPAGELPSPLGRAPGLRARTGDRRPPHGAGRRPRPRHSFGPARARLRAVLPRGHGSHRPSRVGARARHRARLRRGERRPGVGGVAARAGDELRRRVPPHPRGGRRRAGGPGSGLGAVTRRILVVDDEPQILRALRVVLRDAGFLVVPAATAEEALDAAALQPPEAAIVDLVLPDADGVEVTRRLREWTQAPILVLSAVGDEDAKVRALQAGADDYVTKPFGPKELVARIEAALRRAGSGPDAPSWAAAASSSTSPDIR